eukprot:361666-Chlamydomonas_euryale.AAC.3
MQKSASCNSGSDSLFARRFVGSFYSSCRASVRLAFDDGKLRTHQRWVRYVSPCRAAPAAALHVAR